MIGRLQAWLLFRILISWMLVSSIIGNRYIEWLSLVVASLVCVTVLVSCRARRPLLAILFITWTVRLGFGKGRC